MSTEKIEWKTARTRPLPDDLKTVKVVRRLEAHYNFGRDGGAATYSMYEADGQPLPFSYQYRSGSKKPNTNFSGYLFRHEADANKAMSGPELLAAWPAYVAQAREKGEL